MQINTSHAIQSHLDVDEICKPLFSLFDLNFFRYLRVYQDSSRIHLCTDPKWTTHFYEKDLHRIAWCDSEQLGKPRHQEMIWDAKALTEDNIVGVTARQEFNICHGMSVVRASKQYYEVFDFATLANNTQINNCYTNKFDYFERFIFYFKDHASQMIQECSKDPIKVIPDNPCSLSQDDNKSKAYLASTKSSRFYINTMQGDVYLTLREMECIYWAFDGRSTKEIALLLGCTKLTVDDHFKAIKLKLGVRKITQVIRLCFDAGLLSLKAYSHRSIDQSYNQR